MIGLGKVWKAVTGRSPGGGDDRPPGSTIPRDIAKPRPKLDQPVPDAFAASSSETRAAERFVPQRTATVVTTASGKRIAARIINISQIGVALEAELSEFSPTDVVLVGTRPVVPGRRIALGIVFLFKKPLDPKLCSPDIIL